MTSFSSIHAKFLSAMVLFAQLGLRKSTVLVVTDIAAAAGRCGGRSARGERTREAEGKTVICGGGGKQTARRGGNHKRFVHGEFYILDIVGNDYLYRFTTYTG